MVYDVLDELVLVEATVPETTEEDVGPVVDEELDDDVTVPLFVLVEFVGLELEVEADEIEDVLLDELVVATEEELLDELMLLVVELVDETEDVLLDELVLLVVELVLLLVDELEVLETVAEELLLVVELLDELVLEVLVVELVTGLPPTAIRLLPEMTYTRLLPNIGRWNFARPTVPGTLVIGSSTPLVGTARKADNPLLVSAIQT